MPQVVPELVYSKLRWSLVLVTVLPVPLVMGAVVGVTGGSVWLGPLVAAIGVALLVRSPLCRGLACTDEGILVRRDAYRLIARWDDVVEVSVRRRQFLLRAEELILADSEVQPIDSRNRPSRIPPAVYKAGADRRIQVSFYDKHWRTGRIGEELRLRGVID